MPESLEDNLNNVPDAEIIKEIEADNEKDYLRQLKEKGKEFLLNGMTLFERERVAEYICDRFEDAKPKHEEMVDRMQEYDEVYRMERQTITGDDGDMPNYRSAMSTVALDVMHSNIMNVFFTPKDTFRTLPVEEGDVSKVKKIDTYGNWSMKNELNLEEQIDRLFHSSAKNGECPYIVHWVKEYGTEIKRKIVRNPADPTEPLYDPDTKEPLFQEIEEQKLLYNGPKLEVLSRKDYIQPENAMMDKLPEWEMLKIRMNYDEYLRAELQGKMYKGSIKDIMDWSGEEDSEKEDLEGDFIPLGKWNTEFLQFYGRLRVSLIKRGDDEEVDQFEELEDEFIAIVHKETRTLCQLRRNKFPLKMRPVGMDYFELDDDGRRVGVGSIEKMEGLQKAYDALFNQFIFGTVQSNNPFGFFSPTANQRDEPIKIRNGYIYPTADPRGVNMVTMPPPDASIQVVLQLINQWSQLLFGISDFAAGTESKTDPTGPAKKAEIIVAQGNVRLNNLIKRKSRTLKDIFKRWFLLNKANMPPNKFMRIAGAGEDPWKFESVTLSDFALKSIPDFELVGNILNSNKSLEINKKIGTYQLLIANPLFNPETPQGAQALHSITKWLMEELDEGSGLSRFLPDSPGDIVATPEEENARFLQGDQGEPTPEDEDLRHIEVHTQFVQDPNIPEELRVMVAEHINLHVRQAQEKLTQQLAVQQPNVPTVQGGENVGVNQEQGADAQGAFGGAV